MSLALAATPETTHRGTKPPRAALAGEEAARAVNYPLSRWYLRPLAGSLARGLSATRVRPCHVTACGFLLAVAAAMVLLAMPRESWLAAALTLAYWFCDRADGQLARLRGAASPLGAWLDANVDELADIGLHAALAFAAATSGSAWAWSCFMAFVAGKYLLMYGLFVEPSGNSSRDAQGEIQAASTWASFFKRLYHLPGNADVRLHLLVLAMLTGQHAVELAAVAAYYNLRWLARYPLVARRLGAASP